ncbi:MAG TPA: 16S rRNA (cytosine(1402)-N(4))-methyltransferase, partial [Aggregatilineaceae bacterium]|nr:16S rRNA (cytosine(1402)-N(4))-methyltransferase [Aggregatilineaceae bacterium]
MPDSTPHIPVMLAPVLDLLRVADLPAGQFVDGTLGAGGHSFAMLRAAPDSRLLGLDRDPHALELARAHLSPFAD